MTRIPVNILVGLPMVGWGLYVLIRHRHVARSGARFHRRIAKTFPWYTWGNPNVSDEAWRHMAPAIGIFMIAAGIVILIFVPSN
jgi:hypothetical protein